MQYTRAITDDPIIRIYSKGELCPTSSVFPVPRRVCQKPGCRPSYIYCFTCSCTDIMTCSQLSALNISKWVARSGWDVCGHWLGKWGNLQSKWGVWYITSGQKHNQWWYKFSMASSRVEITLYSWYNSLPYFLAFGHAVSLIMAISLDLTITISGPARFLVEW